MIMKNQLLNLKMIALMCLMMVLGGAKVWAEDLSVDFENELSTYTDWEFSNITSKSSDISAHGGSFCGVTNGTESAFVQTKNVIATPKSISFYISKASKNTTSSSWLIEISKDKKRWSQVATNSATSMAKGEWVEVSLDLQKYSDVYVKIEYSGSTAKRCIDDVILISSPSVSKTLTSLTISGKPIKTNYAVGEEFDPTGLVVTGTYEDNTTAPITDGITWTKNPETMSLGNTSCTVTASVDEVKSEPFVVNGLNVVKAIVFDFTKDWEGITATAPTNNQTNGNQVVAGKELKVDGVVMTATNGEDSNNKTYFTGLYKNADGQNLRVYINGSLTFTAPEGYNLSEISFTGDKFIVKSKEKFSATEKELTISSVNSATWTGNAHAVTFNAFAGVQFETATIKLVAVEPVKPTSVTIDLKAQDGDGLHYATFSSDKNVVFTNDVTVYGVSVESGKVKTTQFPIDYYEVTDATVGDGSGIVANGHYVPANTGVLVEALANSTSYYFPTTTQSVECPANMLKPAPANGGEFTAEKYDCKYYKLAYGDWTNKTQLGFYWGAPEGGKFFVKAGTAYLAVPAGENAAKGFTLNGEATGIEGVNANVENAKAIYNLNGQRVASMAKPGLYIVNGKKVVRK